MQPGRLVGGARGLCTRGAPGLCSAPGVQPGGTTGGRSRARGRRDLQNTAKGAGSLQTPAWHNAPQQPSPGGVAAGVGKAAGNVPVDNHIAKKRVFPPKCSHSPSGRLRRVPQPLGLDLGLAAGRGIALGGEAPGGLHGAGEGSVGFPPSMPIPEATRHGPGDRLEDSTVCPGGPTGRGGQRGPEQGRVPLPARGRAGTGGRSLKANVLLAPRACGILGPGASQRLLSSCIPVQTSAGACLPHSKTSL